MACRRCSEDESAARIILGLGHLQGAFYLLAFGLALALAAFLFELMPFVRRDENPKDI